MKSSYHVSPSSVAVHSICTCPVTIQSAALPHNNPHVRVQITKLFMLDDTSLEACVCTGEDISGLVGRKGSPHPAPAQAAVV